MVSSLYSEIQRVAWCVRLWTCRLAGYSDDCMSPMPRPARRPPATTFPNIHSPPPPVTPATFSARPLPSTSPRPLSLPLCHQRPPSLYLPPPPSSMRVLSLRHRRFPHLLRVGGSSIWRVGCCLVGQCFPRPSHQPAPPSSPLLTTPTVTTTSSSYPPPSPHRFLLSLPTATPPSHRPPPPHAQPLPTSRSLVSRRRIGVARGSVATPCSSACRSIASTTTRLARRSFPFGSTPPPRPPTTPRPPAVGLHPSTHRSRPLPQPPAPTATLSYRATHLATLHLSVHKATPTLLRGLPHSPPPASRILVSFLARCRRRHICPRGGWRWRHAFRFPFAPPLAQQPTSTAPNPSSTQRSEEIGRAQFATTVADAKTNTRAPNAFDRPRAHGAFA